MLGIIQTAVPLAPGVHMGFVTHGIERLSPAASSSHIMQQCRLTLQDVRQGMSSRGCQVILLTCALPVHGITVTKPNITGGSRYLDGQLQLRWAL